MTSQENLRRFENCTCAAAADMISRVIGAVEVTAFIMLHKTVAVNPLNVRKTPCSLALGYVKFCGSEF